MNSIMFSCVSLAGTNKVGTLKQTPDGYYVMVVGALNMFNSSGAFYPYEAVKELFEQSSQFMRRISRGALRGEYGHPVMEVGMSKDDFASRCLRIDEKFVCVHHRKIWLDFDNVKDASGRPVIAIMSELTPDGPYASYLERTLQNPSANVCFSVRSFTKDTVRNGRMEKVLKTVVTWDYVNEPGLAIAEKFKSPSLESMIDKNVSRGSIERAIMNQAGAGMGLESQSVVLTASELFSSMGWDDNPKVMPFLKVPGWKSW
jgi:hypothetical protein